MSTSKANLLREKLQEAGWDMHGARLNFISRFVMALITVRTVSLATLASALNAAVEIASNEKRIKRFFGEIAIEGEMLARCVLAWLPKERYLLTLDRTNWKLGSIEINILMLGVAHEGMAYPLLWVVLPHAGSSDTQERLALVDRLLVLLRPERIEALLADREFIGEDWYQGLENRGIALVMRIKSNTRIGSKGRYYSAKRRYGHLQRGEVYVCPKRCWVFGSRLFLAATRAPDGELLVVACTAQAEWALPRYARRWDIETLFGALKRRGFNLEDTHLTQAERLNTLLALLALAFTWAYLLGTWLHEQKPLKLKKHGYAPKSLFKRGFELLRAAIIAAPDEAKYPLELCLEVLSP
jgi:hypothetical protein